jgi:HlyD family secretion protein
MANFRAKMKAHRKWIFIGAAVLIVAFFGFRWWNNRKNALPDGIASGNGRVESKEVDVASKLPLKVKEVLVQEGDLVKPGQVLVKMDTTTLEAELLESQNKLAAAKEQLAVAKAAITKTKSQINLAKIEKKRAGALVKERAGSQRELDVKTAAVQTTTAGLGEDVGNLAVAEQQVKVAEADVQTKQSRIDDATLTSPVIGRVLYRLAEPGEVLAAGGKALTVVDFSDIYMEIFLPSNQAGSLKIGSEARITLDSVPGKVAAAKVSFVSPEAQFTPKQVETKSEREKLMFRVKISVPKELVLANIERIKTGVRGMGYVKYRENATWPEWLDKNLVQPPQQGPVSATPSALR